MTAYYNENNPDCVAWLRELIKQKLIPDGVVDDRSIVDVMPEDLHGFTQKHFFAGVGGWALGARLAGWPDKRPVETVSCPCQPLSCAGAQQGELDIRHLWPEYHRIKRQLAPCETFGEQVASPLGIEWCDGISLDLEELGYDVAAFDLPAASVGAPHIRQRLYWVADTPGIRQSQSWLGGSNAEHHAKDCFREASGVVDAVRRGALPFLCSRHNGVSVKLARIAAHGFGNAIVPELAAQFIGAYLDLGPRGLTPILDLED